MKTLFLQIVIFGLATAALAEDSQYFSITPDQAIEVKQMLDKYEINASSLLDKNGYARTNKLDTSGVLDTNDNTLEEQSRELIGYYLTHTNEVSLNAKLLISRCFFSFGLYSYTINLAQEYVNVYSNDFRAWNMLGTTYFTIKSYDKAIKAYTNAVRLGDKKPILL